MRQRYRRGFTAAVILAGLPESVVYTSYPQNISTVRMITPPVAVLLRETGKTFIGPSGYRVEPGMPSFYPREPDGMMRSDAPNPHFSPVK